MKTTDVNHKKKFRGISLMVLIITVIVMIILASAVILMVVNKDTIDVAKEAALRTDMRTMLDNYDQRYREVLYGYQGDESKIKNSDFDGVVPDSYLDTGDYVAEKDGVRYQGDDERTKEIAKEMGLLVGNDGMLTGIDSVSVSDTTTSTAKAEVNLTGNPKGDFNYTYYVYDGTRWIVVGDSVAEGIYTIKGLKYNWSYKLKVEVSDNYDNTFTSDEVAFTTEELLIGRVILRLNDKNGSDYVPGEWTNQNVYIEAVQTDQNTETSYVVSGANTISRKTQVGSVLALQGESTATIITSDGANEVTSEAKILIDKENPTGSLELTSSTNSITARVMNPDDNLSGIKEFRYYIDGIIQATQNDPNYTFTTDIKQNTKYNIKVVIVDNAGNEGVIEKEVTTETVPSAENIVIEASPTDWTNGDVNVTIKYSAIPGMRVQYSKNGTDWEVIGNINTSGEYRTTVSENNTTVYARYVDVTDQSGLSKTLTIQNIDKEIPTIDSLVSEESPNSDLELILVGKATDNLSGLVAYQFSTDGNLNANSGGWTSITKTNSQITQRYTIYDNGTYYFYVKDLAGNVGKKEIVVTNIDRLPPEITNVYTGTSLYTDQTFKSGLNGTRLYNNAANGTVTYTRVAKSSDAPTSSSYMMQIRTSGTARPGLGGFTFETLSAANKEFVTRIIAKIPVGYTINWASNMIGNNYGDSNDVWLTSQAGTGKFEEYIIKVKCDPSGSFSTTNFFYLDGPAATSSKPVTWYVAFADVIDTGITGQENSIIFTATDNKGVTSYGINQSNTTAPTYTTVNTPGTLVGGGTSKITANGTHYIWVRDANGNIGKKSVSVTKVDRTAPTITRIYTGTSLFKDQTFTSGLNGTNVYNNSGNGTVTNTRVAKSSDAPTSSSYMMQIRTSGTASPGLGGFYFGNGTAANKEFVTRIIAKIPLGYTLEFATNATGSTGMVREWLTSQAGTGKFEEYVFRLKCGSDGSFSSTNFYYLNGPAATASNPVTWYVAFADVIDTGINGTENSIIFAATDNVGVTGYGINQSSTSAPGYTYYNTPGTKGGGGRYDITSNGTYYIWARDEAGNAAKRSVSVNKVQRTFTVSFNANGGSVSPTSKTVTFGSTYGSLPAPTRTGYTFTGWYTAPSGGSRVLGTTAVTTAANHTLYAQWTINSYYIDLNLFLDGASYGSSSRVTANLTVGGVNKGYVSDYWTAHPYGTSWSVNGVRVDGTNIPYSRSGTLGTSTVDIRIDFYTLTIARNSSSYGTVSASSLITLSGTSYSTSGSTLTMSDGRRVTASPTAATGYSTSFSSWSPSSATMNTTRTVTANFSRTGNTYYVAYNGNGATGGSTATSTHRYGTASNLRANGFVKNWPNGGGGTIRWSFRNWNRNSAGTSTSYSNRQSILNLATSGTVTLYAQWSFNNATGVMGGSNDVNMRTGPGSGYANIGGSTWPTYAVRGANCTITNAAYQNYGSSGTLWLYVTCAARNLQVDTALGTKTGWVSGDYVRIN